MLTTHFSAKEREEGLGPGAQVQAGGSWAQPLVHEAQSFSACLDGVSTRPDHRPGLGAGPSIWYLGICSPVATHSSVLAWRIPGTEEPGGLPSMGSHRVGHD